MQLLKQSTAATWKAGPFVDSTDGATAETGLTIAQADIRLSKNGGDFGQTNNAAGAAHDEAGWYDVPLDATDTATLGRLTVSIAVSGALPVWAEFLVVPANVYDSLVSGSDALQVHANEITAGLITAAAIADNAIDAGAIAANAITAAKIATGAIDADALAADAVAEILTTQMTESYNSDGAAPTLAQALFGILQALTEFSISGTTWTIKKLDGSTTAMTLTLDSATNPTGVTRSG